MTAALRGFTRPLPDVPHTWRHEEGERAWRCSVCGVRCYEPEVVIAPCGSLSMPKVRHGRHVKKPVAT